MTEKKKGLSPWTWVAIGCAGLILIAFAVMSAGIWFAGKKLKQVAEDLEENPAKTAAEWVVKANPDLELVESDEEEGTLTVRDKETGEVATFDYSEIEEGRLSFETSEGVLSVDATGTEGGGLVTFEGEEGQARLIAGEEAIELPSWLPEYPRGSAIEATFSATIEGVDQGAFGFSTADAPAEVLAFYRERLEAEGFQLQENTSSEGGEVIGGMLTAASDEEERGATVIANREGDATNVSVQYSSSAGGSEPR
jgi:hypothetical protein